jgi:hypothetical protein
MNKTPILLTYEDWANSQLSTARHIGGIRINGHDYSLVSEHSNRYTPDLLRDDWIPVYRKLGRGKTIGLINNGTSLNVVKQIIKSMDKPQEEPKLSL